MGEQWQDRLFERLRWADAVVCVITSAFVGSAWCSAEVGVAISRGSRVVPVVVEAGVRHPLLAGIQFADYAGNPSAARAVVAEALRRVELDASWCAPGGEPASPLANGGAFGGKVASPVMRAARELADRHGRAVRVLWAREDAARFGPKRPPIAAGVRRDGWGVIHAVRTEGFAARVREVAPSIDVVEFDVAGPATSIAIRGAGWVEAAVLLAAAQGDAGEVRLPHTGVAGARIASDGTIHVSVSCGDPLDEIALRSYCIGAAHMAYSWVVSERLAVADDGAVHDLTIRSFGVVRAVDMPRVEVDIASSDGPPVNGSDAVFAAVAAATWLTGGLAPSWPTGALSRST